MKWNDYGNEGEGASECKREKRSEWETGEDGENEAEAEDDGEEDEDQHRSK